MICIKLFMGLIRRDYVSCEMLQLHAQDLDEFMHLY